MVARWVAVPEHAPDQPKTQAVPTDARPGHVGTARRCARATSRAGRARRAVHHAARTGNHDRQCRLGTGGPDGRDAHHKHDDGDDGADGHAERAAARANEDGQSTHLRRGKPANMHTDNWGA
jgi:hypothetical protein